MAIDRKRVVTEAAYRNEMRLKCQTEHFFLAKMLGYDKLLERVHGPAVELYVKKNPAIDIEHQRDMKQTMQLDPRGTYKSTVKVIDAVQWIVCFPNVRYCKFTATKDLAKAFAGEIAGHFVCAKKPKDMDKPLEDAEFVAHATDFQLLFPEFVITPAERKVGEYTAPCRTIDWKEKTVMAFSNEATISGWHFDVGDIDDIVDTANSSTPQGIKKTKKNWNINKKTFMPWAYLHFTGTRYDPFDQWGDMVEKADPRRIKMLIRGALKLKNGKRLEPGKFPDEKDMILLFPELLSYDFLKAEFDNDYESFMTQYMNDAHGGHEIVFTIESLIQATISCADTAIGGQTFIHWRFGYSDKKRAAAAAGTMDSGRMCILETVCGLFKPSNLAHEVVMMAKRHGLHRISIEETPGAHSYEPAIMNYAATMRWPLEINWTEFQEDEGVRDLRMKSTEPLITMMRLLFSESIDNLSEVYRQMKNYGMVEDTELPDVISQVASNLPKSIARQEISVEEDLAWELAQQQDAYNRTHGLAQYAPAVPVVVEKPWTPQPNSYGLEDIMPGLNG